MNNPKKLTKSRTNKVISGVAGGLGEYANVDPLVFRILFVVLAVGGGFGLIAYLVLLIMMPEDYSFSYNTQENRTVADEAEYEVMNDNCSGTNETKKAETEYKRQNTADFSDWTNSRNNVAKVASFSIGFLLMILGAFILISKLLPFSWWEFVFPVVLLLTGIIILTLSIRSKK